MHKFMRILTAVALLTVLFGSSATAQAPSIGLFRRLFTVNGVPKFLQFVSYFDAMRRSNSGGHNTGDLDTDFRYIKAQGFDGIRIFPNWYHYVSGAPADDDALFTNGAALRPGKWEVFQRVLDRATAFGLLIDVSFTWETVTGLNQNIDNYGRQLQIVTELLRGAYPNVLFDIQNEWPVNGPNEGQIDYLLRTYIRPTDPNRLVTASMDANSVAAQNAGEKTVTLGLDTTAFHEPRGSDWYFDSTAQAVTSAIIAGQGAVERPIYLQEPMPFATICPPKCDFYDRTPMHHRLAARAAQRKTGAAWTFHTRTTFDLADGTFKSKLDNDTAQKIEFQSIKTFVGLWPDDSVFSESGNIQLIYTNGNIELRGPTGNQLWSSNTAGTSPGHTWMQDDGNLVVYDASGVPQWASDTGPGNTGAYIVIDEDGHFRIVSASGATLRTFP